jgi:hypothetical protein
VDGVKNVRAGWYAATFPPVGWSAEAESFQIKLWVGGQPSAAVRFGRLLILKSTP